MKESHKQNGGEVKLVIALATKKYTQSINFFHYTFSLKTYIKKKKPRSYLYNTKTPKPNTLTSQPLSNKLTACPNPYSLQPRTMTE